MNVAVSAVEEKKRKRDRRYQSQDGVLEFWIVGHTVQYLLCSKSPQTQWLKP